jgi:6-phosphogluconolactonase
MIQLRKFHVISLFLLICGFAASAMADNSGPGQVYTMTNASSGNSILIFTHHPQQGLVSAGSVSTGGDGTGAGLGNQGGVILSDHQHFLFAVNAGSNSISVFRVHKGGLTLVDTASSGGSQPVSLTQHDNLLYVLNAGSDSIAGFTINNDGTLSPLADSMRGLSGTGTGAAQISFTPRGDALVVTEKATNQITTFLVDEDGVPGQPVVNPSAGTTPFGFDFDRYGHLLVSEAAGGATDASSLSSYEIQEDGTLVALASAVPTTETAACWVEMSRNGRYAFTTNAGSSSISAFESGHDGSLMLTTEDGVAATTGAGSAPIDLALSTRGNYLFSLSAANGTIAAFRLVGNRQLVPMPGVTGLPTTVNGLAAN